MLLIQTIGIKILVINDILTSKYEFHRTNLSFIIDHFLDFLDIGSHHYFEYYIQDDFKEDDLPNHKYILFITIAIIVNKDRKFIILPDEKTKMYMFGKNTKNGQSQKKQIYINFQMSRINIQFLFKK